MKTKKNNCFTRFSDNHRNLCFSYVCLENAIIWTKSYEIQGLWFRPQVILGLVWALIIQPTQKTKGARFSVWQERASLQYAFGKLINSTSGFLNEEAPSRIKVALSRARQRQFHSSMQSKDCFDHSSQASVIPDFRCKGPAGADIKNGDLQGH